MANFTVMSLEDDSQLPPPNSLRQAIMDANSNPGPDAIDFAVSGMIVLDGPLPSITEELELNGPGADILAISGNNLHRIFTIDPGVSVRVRDLTVRDGFDPSNGAGFRNQGALALNRCTILNNNVGAGIGGGGVYSPTDASLSAANCTFRQNRSQSRGGAIHMDGARTLAVGDSRFAENIADADGGAICSDTVNPATITGSEFADNRAGLRGGGLAVIASAVLIAASRLVRNVADIAGGAVAASGARLRMTGTQCSDNSSGTDGGGAIDADDSSTVDIDDSALSRNMTAGSGAAVLGTNSVTRLTNVTLAQNRAGSTGGAAHVMSGSLAISFVTVADNAVGLGAAISADAGTIQVKNSLIASTTGGANCSAANIVNLGGNFSTDGSCSGFTVATRAQLNLGPLAINPPGTTETMALLPGSVAIDAAFDCSDAAGTPVTTDQRGELRPQALACDPGAYEAAPRRVVLQPVAPLFVSEGMCGSDRIRRRNPSLPVRFPQ